MEINNNILVDNGRVRINIDEKEAGWIYNKCSDALDIIADYINLDEIESIDDLIEQAHEASWEYADSLVPIYYWDISKRFADIQPWRVDEYALDYAVEYNGEDFSRFQMAIIFADIHTDIQDQINTLEDALEAEDPEEYAIEAALELVERYCHLYYNAHIMNYINDGLTGHAVDYILTYYSDENPTAWELYDANMDAVDENDQINAILLDYFIENKERWQADFE